VDGKLELQENLRQFFKSIWGDKISINLKEAAYATSTDYDVRLPARKETGDICGSSN